MNVCRRNVCSAEIPLSLLAGREKHHDNHSQRLKHQLAAANEASLASAIFPTISLSCPSFFSSLLFSHLYQLCSTSKIQIRQTVIKRKCSDWQWAASRQGLVYFKIGKSQQTRVIVVAIPLDCLLFFLFFEKQNKKTRQIRYMYVCKNWIMPKPTKSNTLLWNDVSLHWLCDLSWPKWPVKVKSPILSKTVW